MLYRSEIRDLMYFNAAKSRPTIKKLKPSFMS